MELPPDHHGVPDALRQPLVDERPIGIQHTPAPAAPAGGRTPPGQGPPHGPGMDPQLLGDVAQIDTSLDQCLNRHEVLRRQHVPLLPDGPIGGGTFSLVVGGLPISVPTGLLPSADQDRRCRHARSRVSKPAKVLTLLPVQSGVENSRLAAGL